MKVIKYIPGGNSFPLVIENNNQKKLVKLRAGMSGEHSILNEWFGNVIGEKIGIRTRKPNWISLSDNLEYSHIYIEVRELIEKSMGLNICFDYLENVKELSFKDIEKLDKKKFIDIYLLDVLMLNIDRTKENLNLLQEEKIIVSDFEASLFFNELLNNHSITNKIEVLKCLKANPFYQKIKKDELNSFLKRLNNIDFKKLISELPNEIFIQAYKTQLSQKFTKKQNTQWEMRELLNNIDNVSLENEEEKQKKRKSNREKFEKHINSIHNKP